MDSITKFERILNLVERARNLDLMTVDVIGKINQQQLDLYRDITSGDYTTPKKKEQSIREKKVKVAEKNIEENTVMDNKTNMNPDEMMDFLSKAMENMKKLKENPPAEPQPPKAEGDTPPQKDLEELGKIKQISATVAEHLRIQIDLHKYAAAAINETHKLSFDLYKQIDSYMKQENT